MAALAGKHCMKVGTIQIRKSTDLGLKGINLNHIELHTSIKCGIMVPSPFLSTVYISVLHSFNLSYLLSNYTIIPHSITLIDEIGERLLKIEKKVLLSVKELNESI